MPDYGAIEVDAVRQHSITRSNFALRARTAALLTGALAVACLVAVTTLTAQVGTVPTEMPMTDSQFTTTTTATCGCCGVVGCYCGCPDTQLANVPDLGTQAAVTPDWTDVVTSLTREVSEDTAEIAGLKAQVESLNNWKNQAQPRLKYLTHIQKWMREHNARVGPTGPPGPEGPPGPGYVAPEEPAAPEEPVPEEESAPAE